MRPTQKLPAASLALVLTAVLATGLASCGKKESAAPQPAPPTAEGVHFVGAELGRAVGGDRSITDATREFGPNDTIYVSVETDGSSAAATLAARWTYEDGQQVDRSETTIAPAGTEHTEFHIAKPDGWPAGGYQVEISLDGRPVQTLDFEVGG